MEKELKIKEKITNSYLIEDIIKKHKIDMNIYYVHSFKVKEGSWDTSALKRDQTLKWEVTRDEDGNPLNQFMEGEGKRFPEFIVNNNKTNYIEIIFRRKPIEGDILNSFKELISRIAPVEVIWILGNHDFLASFMLAFSLKEHFRRDKRITVDVSENPRKARLWGNLLVGWTHRIVGKHTVWSNELAQAFPKLWGDSKFREWHHGDQHKKQNVKITPVFTSGGVICRQITALSPVDKWHTDNVFTDAIPGGESFLWSKEQGVFANFMSWTGQYEEKRNQLVKKF